MGAVAYIAARNKKARSCLAVSS